MKNRSKTEMEMEMKGRLPLQVQAVVVTTRIKPVKLIANLDAGVSTGTGIMGHGMDLENRRW